MDKCRETADIEQWFKSVSRSLSGKETVVHNNINQVRGIRQRLLNYSSAHNVRMGSYGLLLINIWPTMNH
jgi:hypothetical protein